MRSAAAQLTRGTLFLMATVFAITIGGDNDKFIMSMAPDAHCFAKLSCTVEGDSQEYESKVAEAGLKNTSL